MLTWWQGRDPPARLRPGRGRDLQHLLPAGRARARRQRLPRRPPRVPADAAGDGVDRRIRSGRRSTSRAMGGSTHGVVNDSVVQEIDIKTGLVMWEWHALGHIPLRDSYNPIPHHDQLGLRPRQLDRPRTSTATAAVGSQHLGDLRRRTCTPAASSGGSAASTRASSAARDPLLLAARRRLAARRARLGVRQRLVARRRRSSRAASCSTPTPRRSTRHARQAVHEPQRDAARLEPGRPAAACPAATG